VFTGTKFTLTFAKYSNRGSFEVWLDGTTLVTTINANSASLLWQQTYTSPTYTDGTHTVTIKNISNNGSYIDLDAIQIFGVPVAVGAGTYDDAHAAWSYGGAWTAYTGSGPANNTMHLTDMMGNSAELLFNGTRFILTFAKYSNRGLIDVYVDGRKITTLNTNSSTLAWQQTYTSPSYPVGNHTVRLVHAGGGSYIDLDAIQIIGAPVPVLAGIYDDANSNWVYSGNWTTYTGSGPANDTMHFTNAQNASASITFTGTQFTVYFAWYSNRGSVEVWIDGVPTQHTFNENGGSLVWQQSWTLPVPLSSGTHTVEFRNPTANTATYIDIDMIEISQ
jgi:hypothetical protein